MSSRSSGSSRLRRFQAALLSILLLGVNVAFPATPLDITVEVYYDATWNDVTDYVFDREGRNSIAISRGRGNGSSRCEPGRASLQLDNTDGRFSPRNPNSPLFGKIGRNTKLRIKVTENAVTYTRFVGEVLAWPTRWDPSESDVWVPLEAWGILRRLSQGASPLRSPLYRTIAGISANDVQPLEYWPMEDGSTSSQIASAIAGRAAVYPVGSVTYGSGGPVGSAPVLQASEGFTAAFPIGTYGDVDDWAISLVVNIPSEPASTSTLMRVPVAGGAATEFRLEVTPGSPTTLVWRGYDSAGSPMPSQTVEQPLDGTSNPSEGAFFGNWMMLNVGAHQDGGNAFAVFGIADGTETFNGFNGTGTAGVTGRLANPFTISVDANLAGIGIGHLSVFAHANMFSLFDVTDNALALGGWAGEQAHERVERLCRELGIPVEVTGTQSALMGPQRVETLLNLLEDCAATDRGFLYEQRDDVGLAYRCNSSRYGQ